MHKPVINIVQKAVRFWVESITSSDTRIDLEPLEYGQNRGTNTMDVATLASVEIANLFEKLKIDNRIRDKAAIMGDVAAHFWFDPKKKP